MVRFDKKRIYCVLDTNRQSASLSIEQYDETAMIFRGNFRVLGLLPVF